MINYIDLAFLVLTLVIVLVSTLRGFALSLIGMLRFVVAVPLSFYVSGLYAGPLYDGFVREYVINTLAARIDSLGGTEHFLTTLSDNGNPLMKLLSDTISGYSLFSLTPQALAVTMTDSFLKSTLEAGVRLLLFIAVFLLFYLVTIVIMLILRKARRRDKTPLKTADRVLGAILGLFKSVAVILVVSVIVLLIASADQLQDSEFVKLINDSKIIDFINHNELLGGIL